MSDDFLTDALYAAHALRTENSTRIAARAGKKGERSRPTVVHLRTMDGSGGSEAAGDRLLPKCCVATLDKVKRLMNMADRASDMLKASPFLSLLSTNVAGLTASALLEALQQSLSDPKDLVQSGWAIEGVKLKAVLERILLHNLELDTGHTGHEVELWKMMENGFWKKLSKWSEGGP